MAKNYRPVSLTPNEIKIMERILRNFIMSHLERNNILSANQHGFRSNRSCATQLSSHLNYMLEGSVEGLEVDSIYVDFAKAFDSVNHDIIAS